MENAAAANNCFKALIDKETGVCRFLYEDYGLLNLYFYLVFD